MDPKSLISCAVALVINAPPETEFLRICDCRDNSRQARTIQGTLSGYFVQSNFPRIHDTSSDSRRRDHPCTSSSSELRYLRQTQTACSGPASRNVLSMMSGTPCLCASISELFDIEHHQRRVRDSLAEHRLGVWPESRIQLVFRSHEEKRM